MGNFKKSKKYVVIALVGVLSLGVFTGCGGNSPDNDKGSMVEMELGKGSQYEGGLLSLYDADYIQDFQGKIEDMYMNDYAVFYVDGELCHKMPYDDGFYKWKLEDAGKLVRYDRVTPSLFMDTDGKITAHAENMDDYDENAEYKKLDSVVLPFAENEILASDHMSGDNFTVIYKNEGGISGYVYDIETGETMEGLTVAGEYRDENGDKTDAAGIDDIVYTAGQYELAACAGDDVYVCSPSFSSTFLMDNKIILDLEGKRTIEGMDKCFAFSMYLDDSYIVSMDGDEYSIYIAGTDGTIKVALPDGYKTTGIKTIDVCGSSLLIETNDGRYCLVMEVYDETSDGMVMTAVDLKEINEMASQEKVVEAGNDYGTILFLMNDGYVYKLNTWAAREN